MLLDKRAAIKEYENKRDIYIDRISRLNADICNIAYVIIKEQKLWKKIVWNVKGSRLYVRKNSLNREDKILVNSCFKKAGSACFGDIFMSTFGNYLYITSWFLTLDKLIKKYKLQIVED